MEEEEEKGKAEADERVSVVQLLEENLGLLKRLNAVLFPINYQQRYYVQALASGPFSQLAFCGDTCVGSITCRIERTLAGRRLYILTLGVLAPYRRLGIGSKLMNIVLELSEKEEDLLDVYLHVQVNNEEALQFYKKFGFEVQDIIRNYYRRIEPPDCYLLSKNLARKLVTAD
ncbi:hypothetical protein GOP47_0025267 [Adiantum capillus-veneris]|uniref:N-acetyltransferase domain-containing protein n=1 Tax=Adiantum capillus-veneris TaxID=13818 RepID=A0A9D4U0D8_ADICA|nr:hypothetical protein GOP47_0025267 [Adiantum capillus-veneris]